MARRSTPAQRARERAGYTLQGAARALGLSSARSWRSIELRGGASMKLAERAGRLFGCSGNLFLFPPREAAPESVAQLSSPTAAGADTPAAVIRFTARGRAGRRAPSRGLTLLP